MPNLVASLRAQPPKEINYRVARMTYAAWRADHGYISYQPLLSPPDANHKMSLSGEPDYALCLAQARLSGWNICPFSTPQCRATCVAFTGRGGAPAGASGHSVMDARILKTQFLAEHRDAFCTVLKRELETAVRKHGHIGARLNAFGDIPWEEVAPWVLVPGVTFYDYTKDWSRVSLDNYWLTYSASERDSERSIAGMVKRGCNVAVVFNVNYRPGANSQAPLPTRYAKADVIDADVSDTRYLDPKGVVVGLRAKGLATTLPVGGFVKAAV